MTEGNFVDYVKINLSSGNGGKGSSLLDREKYNSIRKANLHKMEAIPVCKIPK